MNDNPAALSTAVGSCHNWLPHHRHPPLLCRGEEALTASTLTKCQGPTDSGGPEGLVPTPYLHPSPKIDPGGLGYEIRSSSLHSGKCLTPRREQKCWNSLYARLLSGPLGSYKTRRMRRSQRKIQGKEVNMPNLEFVVSDANRRLSLLFLMPGWVSRPLC